MYATGSFVLGDVLLSQDPAVQVPSALKGLTVVFEMGTRGSLSPLSPNMSLIYRFRSRRRREVTQTIYSLLTLAI